MSTRKEKGCVINNGVLTKYVGSARKVVIPNDVTAIGENAFSGDEYVSEIIIPEGVTHIGNFAFEGCYCLRSVKIPQSVMYIGNWAFANCSGIEVLELPDHGITIDAGAFHECQSLADENGFVIIRNVLYSYCGKAKTVTVPSDVTVISNSAFMGCNYIRSIIIPESVRDIGAGAFCGCVGLADENGFVIIRDVLYDYIGQEENVTIPLGVTSISDWAFSNYQGYAIDGQFVAWHGSSAGLIRQVTIPQSVTSIGACAFYGCYLLKNIEIPESVTWIGVYAFDKCSGLKIAKFPERVKTLMALSQETKSPGTIVVPEDVKIESKNHFYIHNNILKGYDGKDRKVVIPDGVQEIDKEAFAYNDKISEVVIPDSVHSIGENAFWECTKLRKVTFPTGLKKIGDGAFFLCPLTKIDIPDSVTSIGDLAFSMTWLRTVTIPKGVTSIGTRAFNVHSGVLPNHCLEEVILLGTECTFGSYVFPAYSDLRIYAPNMPLSCFSAQDKRQIVRIFLTQDEECSEERIKDYLNYINRNNTLVENLITEENASVLARLLQLRTKMSLDQIDGFIQMAEKKAEIKSLLLAYKANHFTQEDIEKEEEKERDLAMGFKTRTVTEWKKLFSFDKTADGLVITGYKGNEEVVEVPGMIGKDPVIAIGDEAFSSFKLRAKNRDARRNIKQVFLPSTIISIGNRAFYWCSKLEWIEFPESLTTVGDRAFEHCEKLKTVVIPKSLKKFDRIFLECTSLTSVIVSEGVTTIGYSFSGCKNLSDVTIPASVTKIDSGAFYRCPKVKFHAPAGSYAEEYARKYGIPFVVE